MKASSFATVAGTLFLLPAFALAQGPLTPPAGTPGPTMKALDQIQPRTDLNRLAGDASAVCVIPGPGSYYLTADLVGAAGKETIRVASAGRVTIDLNGFALTNTGSDHAAIALFSANDAVVVRNGTILAAGGTKTRAVGGGGNRVVCEDLSVVGGTGADLLVLGADGVVRRCQLSGGGLAAGDRSSIVDSGVTGTSDLSVTLGADSAATGLRFTTNLGQLAVGDRSKLIDCQVNAAGPPTSLINGAVVQAGTGVIMRHCSVSAGKTAGNAVSLGSGSVLEGVRVLSVFRDGIVGAFQDNVTLIDCSVQGHGRAGIVLGANARVRDCNVNGFANGVPNGSNAIAVGENSAITGCTISGVGGAGILSSEANVAVSRSVVKGTGGGGISLVSGSVTDCDVTGVTGGAGIQVTQSTIVQRNRSTNSGTVQAPQSGLKAIGPNNRLEGNQLLGNTGFGLEVTSTGAINANTGNLVIGNCARSNAAGNFSTSSGNTVGPVITASTIGGSTDVHPSANYTP